MTVRILEKLENEETAKNSIRADLAWELMLPDYPGDLPEFGGKGLVQFRHWLWDELSRRLGFLRGEPEEEVIVCAPALTPAGKEFLVRTCSFWTNEVYHSTGSASKQGSESHDRNLWTAPIVNVNEDYPSGAPLERLTETEEGNIHTFQSAVLGATRSFMRTYIIPEGGTYSRFHSHTAREEIYLVLKGKGTARIGSHSVTIREGDFLSKPTGPDLSTQFLADQGESIRIMDIEIWPDDERRSKDLVHYPDHGELDLFGAGWNLMIPAESVMDFRDAMENYSTGYYRKADGSWEPKEVPGFKKREK